MRCRVCDGRHLTPTPYVDGGETLDALRCADCGAIQMAEVGDEERRISRVMAVVSAAESPGERAFGTSEAKTPPRGRRGPFHRRVGGSN